MSPLEVTGPSADEPQRRRTGLFTPAQTRCSLLPPAALVALRAGRGGSIQLLIAIASRALYGPIGVHMMHLVKKAIYGFDTVQAVCYSPHNIAPRSTKGAVRQARWRAMGDLLTTNQVQDLLQVDRTTIYRMVGNGQLPAIRVGKQWRFARAEIERWLRSQGTSGLAAHALAGDAPAAVSSEAQAPAHDLAELLPLPCVQMIQDTFADALGVMIVVTDMKGVPITRTSNSCGLYDTLIGNAEAAERCIQGWQRLAGGPALEPKFTPSDLGLLCARGLIRSGNELKGMVFLGGIAPEEWPPSHEQIEAIAAHYGLEAECVRTNIEAVHRLDKPARERALGFVQRLADIYSHMLEDWSNLHSRLQTIASLSAL